MLLNSSRHRIIGLALLGFGLLPSRAAEAGPLLDWLFGRSQPPPAYAVGSPVVVGNGVGGGLAAGNYATGYAPNGNAPIGYAGTSPYGGNAANYGTYYNSQLPVVGPAGNGYLQPQVGGAVAATMPPTVSYVPNYRTNSYRAPVTYYRPLLTTDPNTGAQVVAMAPCTSYEYQTQRVPTLGRRSLFGSYGPPPVAPPPTAPPNYTLPSGGIPLAYGTSPMGPSVMGSTLRGYGGYTTLQPPVTDLTAPSGGAYLQPGNYNTSPYGTQPYYGSTSGGSCGGANFNPVPSGSVPGLMAPQGPAMISPSDSFSPGAGSVPGSASPSGIYPDPNQFSPPPSFPGGSSSPSSGLDPANIPPTLPPMGTTSSSMGLSDVQATNAYRPKLRSIYREPREDSRSVSNAANSSRSGSSATSPTTGQDLNSPVPSMMPLPGPQNYDMSPRWNPGLLSDEDKTAQRAIQQDAFQVAGQSKPIRWASFDADRSSGADKAYYESSRDATAEFERGLQLSGSAPATSSPGRGRLRSIPSHGHGSAQVMKPVLPATDTGSDFRPWPGEVSRPAKASPNSNVSEKPTQIQGRPASIQPVRPAAPHSPYDTNGWKPAR